MAQHASAEKQARKSVKNRERNKANMSKLRTTIKRVRSLKDKDTAQTALNRASKVLDQLAAKGLIHKNKAANQKSSLKKYVNSLAAAAPVAAK